MSYYIPIVGFYNYSKSFKPNGVIYGAKNVLFAFWMACYHGSLIGAPLGLILSQILN
jgi:hypothetical protein